MQLTVKEIIRQFREELSQFYNVHEAFQFVWLIFDHLHGWTKTDMLLREDTKLTDSDHLFVQNVLERLKNHEPIQYIIGETEFFGLSFDVNPSVLIPRPETEELVEWILESVTADKSLRILDIGTGSGCIAVSLARHLPGATVTAWDVSSDALMVAENNARKNKAVVSFVQKDVLKITPDEMEQYDIIVSNPPYVRELEKDMMKENVLNHEPQLALFVEDHDPLVFYRHITRLATESLLPDGLLFFEINRDMGRETMELLADNGFRETELRKDLSGNFRMLKALGPLSIF
ncbi:peptide chain release factor N(5)-glutamine methyltransferase [Marinilabilia salmonicolor]|uniref:peptide chain release factor N(5)-glutamine methyltransferase n=1 Tax=Marinilabilia salmonicolor TaxID=989 RepID=UPI00029A9BB0|nr:peptide chain release factor N(5)-glutamine methyltransferase [Marinilabilia salmonicolor]